MDIKFWLDKWQAGDIQFHRKSSFQPNLVRFFPAHPTGTVFVPLCGKSRDMFWFVEQGWRVIGVEASDLACQAFFEENAFAYRRIQQGAFTIYGGDSITLFCGDFFKLTKDDLCAAAAAYDRAALVALPPDMRETYAAHMTAILPEDATILLIALDYPQDQAKGPPFAVDAAEVHRLFGTAYAVSELAREEDTALQSRQPKFKHVERAFETTYLLRRLQASSYTNGHKL